MGLSASGELVSGTAPARHDYGCSVSAADDQDPLEYVVR